jgi:transposase
MRANASRKKTLGKEELEFLIKFVDEELEEWAKQDQIEDEIFGDSRGDDQLPNSTKKKVQKAVKDYIKEFKEKGNIFKRDIKGQLNKAYQELEENQLEKVNITDPESRFMKNKKDKIELSYNPQITVDKNGFILANDVCKHAEDTEQLQPQVLQTEENLGSIPEKIHWNFDNGYWKGDNLLFLEYKKIDAYIPDQKLAQSIKGKNPKKTYIETLVYDEESDTYITPEGEVFTFQCEWFDKSKNRMRRDYVLKRNNRIRF